MIRAEQERFMVFDLGSRSGTQVDGESLGGHALSAGDTLSVGRTEMLLMQVGTGAG